MKNNNSITFDMAVTLMNNMASNVYLLLHLHEVITSQHQNVMDNKISCIADISHEMPSLIFSVIK